MTAHQARAVRAKDGWARWSAVCPQGCRLERAESKEGAEFIADEHIRKTTCHCRSVEHVEVSPDAPCGEYCEFPEVAS